MDATTTVLVSRALRVFNIWRRACILAGSLVGENMSGVLRTLLMCSARLIGSYRYCLEFRALRLGSLLGLGLPVTAKARSRAIYIIAVLPIIEYRI